MVLSALLFLSFLALPDFVGQEVEVRGRFGRCWYLVVGRRPRGRLYGIESGLVHARSCIREESPAVLACSFSQCPAYPVFPHHVEASPPATVWLLLPIYATHANI